MATSSTSTLFDYWQNLETTLAAASWPSPTPLVVTGTDATRDVEFLGELVEVRDGDSRQSWAAVGQRKRDEVFSVAVYVRAWLPGQTRADVLARLEALVAVVELAIRPTTTSTVAQMTANTTNAWNSEIAGITGLEVVPSPQGYVASCSVLIQGNARI